MTNQNPDDTFAPEVASTVEYLVMERIAGGPWHTVGDDRPFTSYYFAEKALVMNQVSPERPERSEYEIFVREVGPLRRA